MIPTRDDIERWRREGDLIGTDVDLANFASIAYYAGVSAGRAAALEEAAKVCDEIAAEKEECGRDENDERFLVYAKHIRRAAAAIRALAQPPKEAQK